MCAVMEKKIVIIKIQRSYYKFYFLLFFNFLNNSASYKNILKDIFCTELYDKQIIFYDILNKNS